MKKLLGIFAGICLCVCASEGRAEETLPELSKAGHEAFDDLIEGRAMLERCAEGDKPCPLKLTELHKKIRAEYSVNDQCKAQFRYHFYEIDCGADGVPDLLLQYRGTCIYDRGEDENSGSEARWSFGREVHLSSRIAHFIEHTAHVGQIALSVSLDFLIPNVSSRRSAMCITMAGMTKPCA